MWWPVVVPVWWCHVVARGARVGRLSGLVLVVSEERGTGKGGTQGVEWWCQCGARGGGVVVASGGASVVPVVVEWWWPVVVPVWWPVVVPVWCPCWSFVKSVTPILIEKNHTKNLTKNLPTENLKKKR